MLHIMWRAVQFTLKPLFGRQCPSKQQLTALVIQTVPEQQLTALVIQTVPSDALGGNKMTSKSLMLSARQHSVICRPWNEVIDLSTDRPNRLVAIEALPMLEFHQY
jgi:hypothetical protein